jgi:hypothetical protein
LLMHLVKVDNEENASLCVKTIMDIMRHQTKVLQDKVQPFLGLIQELFDQMESVVRDQLDNPAPGVPSTPGSSQAYQNSPRPGSPVASVSEFGADPQQQTRPLLKGMQSWFQSSRHTETQWGGMSSSSYPSLRAYSSSKPNPKSRHILTLKQRERSSLESVLISAIEPLLESSSRHKSRR